MWHDVCVVYEVAHFIWLSIGPCFMQLLLMPSVLLLLLHKVEEMTNYLSLTLICLHL